MNEKLVTIGEFGTNLEAEMAKSQLEANGIKAVIVGQSIKGLLPADGMLNVQLNIFAKDVEEARRILESSENEPAGQEED